MIDFLLFYEFISCQYFPGTPWIACGHDSPRQHVTDIDDRAQTSASALISVIPCIAHVVQVQLIKLLIKLKSDPDSTPTV